MAAAPDQRISWWRPRRIATLLVLCLLAPPISHVWADPVRDDAKQFAKDVLIPKVIATTEDEALPADVPGFDPNPPQANYADDPLQMEIDGNAAKATNEGYRAMTDSMATRATFAPAEMAATVAPGKAVEADPATYTSGMTVDGQPSKCVPLPQSPSSPGFYEASCNTGYVDGAREEVCGIPLRVETATSYIYHCNEDPITASFNRVDVCDAIDACPIREFIPGRCMQWSGNPPWCSEPGDPIEVHVCPSVVPGKAIKATEQRLVSALPDPSACNSLATNPDCSEKSEVCTDSSPVTRIVNGVTVTQPCWAWERTYTCGSLGVQTDCAQLDSLGCTFLREECLTQDDPCMTLEQVYSCPIPPELPSVDKFICDGDIYCIDGSCDQLEREADTGFADAVVALNSVAQAGREFDPDTLTLFRGEALACTKLIFGVKNCCVPRGIPLIGGCSGMDTLLKTKRDKGLCTYVGSWCSSKILGICLEKKERHCCFGSKITRIIQEQGRPQLGKTWAKPDDEKCAGFTIDEFSQLDLSVMDFSEVYADFVEAASLPSEVDALNDIQAKIAAYYASQGL